MRNRTETRKKILAVASGGGHWVQLLRLRPSFNNHHVEYISTNAGYQAEVQGVLHVVTDANMWQKMRLLKMFIEVGWIVVKLRPDVILTTGAAPGFAAILFGRLLGARTVWIDSIANSEALSASGVKVGRLANVWLTQWEHLSKSEGPHYWGGVL